MKPSHRPLLVLAALLHCLLWFATPVRAQLAPTTLISCPSSTGGDLTHRGFYIESYPGETLNSLTVYLKTITVSAPLSYQIGIDVTLDAYNGPAVGFYHANANIGTAETTVAINCGNVAIPPGRRVCFKFVINKLPGAPDLYYMVSSGTVCPGLIQTNGTEAPLSTIRGNGVKLIVTGRRSLTVTPAWSIQAAINAASVGDTISVAEGTYFENLVLRSGISVKGANPNTTILVPSSSDGVEINNCTNLEFSGFTVRPPIGVSAANVGIWINGGSPLVKDNIITGFPRYGIEVSLGTSALICGNRIQNIGTALDGVTSYGISSFKSVGLISNNLITNNENGALIEGHASDGCRFINNTVVDNLGVGLRCGDSNPIVMNNIVVRNAPGILAIGTAATPALIFNNVWNNAAPGNYSAQSTGVINIGLGSLSVDPQFDPASPNDFRLAVTSPCINAGNPAAIDNDLDGSRNDMGWLGGPCASPAASPAPFGGFLFTSVGNIPANYISTTTGLASVPPADAAALAIEPWKNAPFAAQPWLYGVLGSGAAAYYYTIECKLHSAPEVDYRPLDMPLSKVKYTVVSSPTPTVTATLQSVGPTVISGVPYYLNTTNGGNTYWAHADLRLVLNTHALADGVYDFRFRAFDLLQNPIPMSNPSHTLTLHINNQPPVVAIHSIAKDGSPPIDECAVVGLTSSGTNLNFTISASHPQGFLHSYALTVGRGRSGYIGTLASDAYNPAHTGSVSWTGVTDQTYASSTAMAASMLPPWQTCAYNFSLGAWSRATNGYGYVYHASASWSLALNLGGADLDGDGDVDGNDLNILAASFGSSFR